MAGLLDSIFGGGGGSADDPYADILTPAQRNQMQVQGLLAMAGAFADAGMPSRLPIPFGAALGKAAAALGTGQDAGMKTAIENALAAQKVRDLRTTAEFRKQFFGDQDKLYQAIQGVIGPGGTAAAASTSPAGTTPPGAGGGGGTGTPAGAGVGSLPSTDLSLRSDANPDFYTSRMTAPGAGGVGRFDASGGLLNYPAATDGMGAGGGGLLSQAPFDPTGFQTKVPSSEYEPGGRRYPFKDLGVVPGGDGGRATPAATGGGAIPAAETQIPGAYYDATEGLKVPGMPGYDPSRAGRAPPPVTDTPGGTNGIDLRRRAALEAILGGIQTAQAGPAAQRLPQFAGPGAADAPALDTVPDGGGLLGVAPDLRAPIEANPFARQASPGDPRGVAPLIRQAMLRQGVDPNVALRVAQSEGLGTFLGDAGKSGGAFQLYTGGGLGNEFQKQTGLDPLDPANEAATIDWVAKNVNRTGWSPFHGAARVGIGARTGLPGGDLPPDEVIPSGPGAGGNRPPVVQAQYASGAGAGGAPMPTAPGAGLPTMQVPVPPGADPTRMNALLLELARRNAAAEVLGMGNPYGSLLSVLQGSPQYKSAVEAATETARRGAGLPFIGPEETAKRGAGLPFIEPEARAKALGGYEVDVATRTAQANLDRVTEQIKQMGTAANTLAPDGILVPDGQGGMKKIQATVAQALRSANGLGVPELGIPPLQPQQQGAGGPGTMPQPSGGGGPIGQSVPLPGQVETQRALLDSNLARSSEQIKDYTAKGQEAALQVANAQAINDLLPRVQLGWGADTRQEAARILTAMGVSPENINKLTSTDPAAGDELKKLFLQFSSGAVRQMGAKEPGSVLELFRSAYPNLETHPDAAQLMNNALMMQARWSQDRAAAAQQWELTQQQNAGPTGAGYKGLLGFDQKFRQTNDPNEYWKAAAAMSKNQDIAWQNTNDQQQQRIFDLIPPGAIFRGPDGKIYQKPNR